MSAATTNTIGDSLARLEDANFRFLAPAVRHREVQATLIGDEQRRPGARRGRDVCEPPESVRAFVLDNIEVAVAAGDVDPFSGAIVKQIVGVADDVERRD